MYNAKAYSAASATAPLAADTIAFTRSTKPIKPDVKYRFSIDIASLNSE
jgi:hypothetical protein